MKLNIGCGYRHLKGYVNIDSDRDSLADVLREAHDLRLESASVDEILATQLIEHLGFFKARYFLSECFRVLRPGGQLTLETPDVERTFTVFFEGDRLAREESLSWLHGSESKGMGHLFCFPVELLREIAAATGFRLQGEEHFPYERNRPALRLTLRKPPAKLRKEFLAELRRRLVEQRLPAFDDELLISCQEELLRLLASTLRDDWRALLRLALHSAEIIREYFALEAECVPAAGRYASVAARLAEQGFQDQLLELLRSNPAGSGCQDLGYRQTLEQGAAIIDDLLEGKSQEPPVAQERRVGLFLPPVIRDLADKTFARGIRELNLERFDQALELFHSASATFRDSPFPYWNAARTYRLLGRRDLARQQYGMAWKALDLVSPGTAQRHRASLADEMREAGSHSI